MEEHRWKLIYYTIANLIFWIFAFGLYLVMFVSFSVNKDVTSSRVVSAVIGILLLFLSVLAISATCSLPISINFYHPQLESIEIQPSISPESIEKKNQESKEIPEQI